ncbi:hypothetical protein M8494_21150 [Serratia ureilytica]
MTYGEPNRGNHARDAAEESSRPLLKQALEAGINFSIPPTAIPTAAAGRSSAGAARLCAPRTWWSPQGVFPLSNLERGLSRANIMQSIDTPAALATTMSIAASTAGIMKRRWKRRWKRARRGESRQGARYIGAAPPRWCALAVRQALYTADLHGLDALC